MNGVNIQASGAVNAARIRRTLVLAAVALWLGTGEAIAQTGEAAAGETLDEKTRDYTDMGEDSGITITESPVDSPVKPEISPYGQRNTVDAETIAEQGSRDLLDALRNVPGVSFSKRNSIGGDTGTSLYIRGRGAGHPSVETVTNFDGIPRNGSIYGQSMPDSFSLNIASGVNVYKSPQISAFGTGYALVDVIPKYQEDQGWQAETGLSLGSFNTIAETASFGFKKRAFDIFAAQGWTSTSGFTNHSAAYQQSYYLNSGYWISPYWNIRLLANFVNSRSERPRRENQKISEILPSFKTDSFLSTLTLNNSFDKAQGWAKLYYSDTGFHWLDENPAASGDYSVQTLKNTGLRARETLWLWKGGEIIAGGDFDITVTSNLDHNETRPSVLTEFPDMFLFSPYLTASHTFNFGEYGKFYIIPQAGLRGYVHTLWANALSPQAGLTVGYKDSSVYGNYSAGCVYPAPAGIQGLVNNNALDTDALKNVKPETVNHYETGFAHSFGRIAAVGGSFFYDDGRDRVILKSAGPKNASFVSYFRVTGVELYGNAKPLSGLSLFAGGTWMKVEARGEDGNTATVMPFTPDLSFSAGFTWTLSCFGVKRLEELTLSGDYRFLGGLYANTELRYSANFTNSDEISRLDDQHILHLRLSWSPDFANRRAGWPAKSRVSGVEVFLDIDNALNRHYEYWPGYRMPGLTVSAGFKAKFS